VGRKVIKSKINVEGQAIERTICFQKWAFQGWWISSKRFIPSEFFSLSQELGRKRASSGGSRACLKCGYWQHEEDEKAKEDAVKGRDYPYCI